MTQEQREETCVEQNIWNLVNRYQRNKDARILQELQVHKAEVDVFHRVKKEMAQVAKENSSMDVLVALNREATRWEFLGNALTLCIQEILCNREKIEETSAH